MKVLPKLIKLSIAPTETNLKLNLDESNFVNYIPNKSFKKEILEDLIDNKAFATSLLYVNENCTIDLINNELVNESNINDFYKDCEDLLNENIEIVEETGIPLVNINGYLIYETENGILRGNGNKKIKEFFNLKESRDWSEEEMQAASKAMKAQGNPSKEEFDIELDKQNAESLAWDLVTFTKEFDPYEFNNNYESDEDAYNQNIRDLSSDSGIDGVIAWLNSIKEEADLEAYDEEALESLLVRLEYLKPHLNEEAEGTQVSDIAPKVDQNLGVNKPKIKYDDIVIPDLNESLDLRVKGFLKNKDGQYQRGNYILVKEGAKYVAIHKDRLNEYEMQGNTLVQDNEKIANALKLSLEALDIEKAFNIKSAVVDQMIGLAVTRKNKNIDLVSVQEKLTSMLQKLNLAKNKDYDFDIKGDSIVIAIINPEKIQVNKEV